MKAFLKSLVSSSSNVSSSRLISLLATFIVFVICLTSLFIKVDLETLRTILEYLTIITGASLTASTASKFNKTKENLGS